MPALPLSAAQTTIVSNLEATLEEAFSSGVNDNNAIQILAAMQLYSTFNTDQKTAIKAFAKQIFASLLVSANLGGFTGTTVLAKITPSGLTGSLTFVNGICTAYVAPT